MTNKELKRASYIYAKKEANILLTLSEQIFLAAHEKEYLESDFHKNEGVNPQEAEALRKLYRLKDDVDVNKFIKERKRIVLRHKFAERLMDEENPKLKRLKELQNRHAK